MNLSTMSVSPDEACRLINGALQQLARSRGCRVDMVGVHGEQTDETTFRLKVETSVGETLYVCLDMLAFDSTRRYRTEH